jgi:predicted transposase/invertase (TIGR01784 family)
LFIRNYEFFSGYILLTIEINILEVKKVINVDDSPLVNRLLFFAAETEEKYTMVAQTRPGMPEAWGVVQILSGDAEARLLAEYEEKARRDEVDRQKFAHQEGLQKGRLEGRLEEKFDTARNALRKKIDHKMIADLTGLSLEEIKQLASDLT